MGRYGYAVLVALSAALAVMIVAAPLAVLPWLAGLDYPFSLAVTALLILAWKWDRVLTFLDRKLQAGP